MKISKLCQDILLSHPETHFSSFINRNGRIVEFKFRDDGKNTSLTNQELEMRYMQCKLQSDMNKEFDEKIGHLDYTMVCRDSTIEVIFPVYDGILFVILRKNAHITKICDKILELITNFDFDSALDPNISSISRIHIH